MMSIKIYAIVVTFNGMKWVERCLRSLKDSSIKIHTIVVDNNSDDNTAEFILQNYPEIELISSTENLGFGKGNNLGLRRALEDNADFVFLLNQDAWVEKDTVEKLIKIQSKQTEYGIISPIHINREGNGLENKFSDYICAENTPGIASDFYFDKVNDIYTTRFVNAAAWLVSMECLKKVGGFNPIYPHYGEDEDYVNRCIYYGYLVGISPCSRVTHDNHFNWDDIEYSVSRNVVMNLVNLTNINQSFNSSIIFFIKKSWDELTTYLIFRKFRKFKVRLKAFWKTMISFNKIRASRKLAKHEGSFLEI